MLFGMLTEVSGFEKKKTPDSKETAGSENAYYGSIRQIEEEAVREQLREQA